MSLKCKDHEQFVVKATTANYARINNNRVNALGQCKLIREGRLLAISVIPG